MVSAEANQKVGAGHLKRNAYLYIRQSTPRQVLENTESTKRQYALQQRAVALGWTPEQVIVIDSDLGQSGATAADREGFQRLVTEVSMGRAGIVLGLEVSRLARNSADWHRLLEICALSETLILDEDGLYDPAHFNDRLLLGLKGTMSEAELHVLQARLRGGALSKAKRGELAVTLPVGFVYDEQGHVILDPDQAVQQSIRLLFATFRRTGSTLATVRAFDRQGLKFPIRSVRGLHPGELVWADLTRDRVCYILRNPRYTGAFVYGRHRTRKRADGGSRSSVCLPQEQWHTILRDAHPGYITWDDYEEHCRRLSENAQSYGLGHRSPPREGPGLLQGLALCARCGRSMTVAYHCRQGQLVPDYVCWEERTRHGRKNCQRIPGAGIDEAIGELLVETVTPLALDVALAVQQEIQSQLAETDRIRQTQVERARYEATLAQRRYMQVDPDNRLVADELEADWNRKLRALADAQQEYERQHKADQVVLDAEQQSRILNLAADFPRLWQDPNVPQRERKRMVRLMLEDATLLKDREIMMHVRFKGGATKTIHIPLPLAWPQKHKTKPTVVAEIDRLLDDYTWIEIAKILNERGIRTGAGGSFTVQKVKTVQWHFSLRSRYQRLRARGLLTASEVAQLLGISKRSVPTLQRKGSLRGHAYNDHSQYLYEPPMASPSKEARPVRVHEVQCEA